jgi:predicted kinase
MHKPDPRKALLRASLLVNTEWLSLLARADILGRVCADQSEMLERIGFFEAYAREQNCWGKPYAFSNGLNRFCYFQKEESHPDYIPFDDTICEVIVMSGLPGMGKDYYIRKQFPHLPVVSLDAIRKEHKLKPEDKSANGWVAQQAKEQARSYLRAGQDFVWNATNITSTMRRQLIDLLTSYKASVRIIYLEQPHKVWFRQNKERPGMVKPAVLEKMLRKLEVPEPSEAHIVEYIT